MPLPILHVLCRGFGGQILSHLSLLTAYGYTCKTLNDQSLAADFSSEKKKGKTVCSHSIPQRPN